MGLINERVFTYTLVLLTQLYKFNVIEVVDCSTCDRKQFPAHLAFDNYTLMRCQWFRFSLCFNIFLKVAIPYPKSCFFPRGQGLALPSQIPILLQHLLINLVYTIPRFNDRQRVYTFFELSLHYKCRDLNPGYPDLNLTSLRLSLILLL